jgi:hypothetical protein
VGVDNPNIDIIPQIELGEEIIKNLDFFFHKDGRMKSMVINNEKTLTV